MKKLFLGYLVSTLMSIMLFSCSNMGNNDSNNNTEELKDSSSNKNISAYEPGKDWKLVWSDEFETDSIDRNNWNLQVVKAGRFNEEWQRYTDSSKNAYVENGSLVIKAIHESDTHGMNQYTSARLNTANKQAWKYGKIAARIKQPKGNGIWPAFWLLGANIDENGGDTPWPQCGEIDIMELYGSKDNGVVEANMHYANEADKHGMMGAVAYKLKEGIFADSFHVFELNWDKDHIKWLVDGEEFASASIKEEQFSEFHNEFFILLNMAVGGTWAGRPDSTTVFPQHMYVDWVRVYKKSE